MWWQPDFFKMFHLYGTYGNVYFIHVVHIKQDIFFQERIEDNYSFAYTNNNQDTRNKLHICMCIL